MITKRKISDLYQFLPTNSLRKCMEISLEKLLMWILGLKGLKKITKQNFHHGALTVTIFMIVIFAGTKL